jgi:hypothetical protein
MMQTDTDGTKYPTSSPQMELLQPALDALRSIDAKRMRRFDGLLPSDSAL